MKKLLINAFLGAACLLSCADTSGMNRELSDEQKKVNEIIDDIHNLSLNESGEDLDRYFKSDNEELTDKLAELINTNGSLHSHFYRALEINDLALATIIFLNDNIDVNQPNAQGIYPLMFALRNGNVSLVMLLVEWGAELFHIEQGNIAGLLTDSVGNDLMYYAIQGGAQIVQWLYMQAESLNPNASFHRREPDRHIVNNITPLMIALQTKNLETVQFLIQEGAKLFDEKGKLATDSDGNNLLYYAILGRTPTVKWLLDQTEVDLNSNLYFRVLPGYVIKFKPIMLACCEKDLVMVQLLIQNGAKLFDDGGQIIADSDRKNLWHYASAGSLEILQFLLKQTGVTPDSFHSENNYSPFIDVCRAASAETVEWFIDTYKVDVDAIYELPNRIAQKSNTLVEAIDCGNAGAVKALLNHKVNPNVLVGGLTPLSLAAQGRNVEIVKMLLDYPDIDVNLADEKEGMTPLYCAVQNRYHSIDILKLLIAHKNIDINKRSIYDRTPLIEAVRNGNVEAVRVLLNKDGIDVNAKSLYSKDHSSPSGGVTALHIAADKGNAAIVALLLSRNDIEINAQSSVGNMPLCYAIMQPNHIWQNPQLALLRPNANYRRVIWLLVNHAGSNISLPNHSGLTPLHIACVQERPSLVRFLIEKGANVYKLGNIDPILYVIKNFSKTKMLKTLERIMERVVDKNQIPTEKEALEAMEERGVKLKESSKQQILGILFPKK